MLLIINSIMFVFPIAGHDHLCLCNAMGFEVLSVLGWVFLLQCVITVVRTAEDELPVIDYVQI